MATKQEISETIRQGNAAVTQAFGGLTEAQLNTQVHMEENGWTAKELLAHLAGRAQGYDLFIGIADGSAAFPAGFAVNEWNRARVDERIANSRDALLAEFLMVHEGLIARVEELSDETLAKPIQGPRGLLPLSDIMRASGGRHSINHAAEAEKVLGSGRPSAYGLPDRSGLRSPFAALHHVALVTNDMKKTVAFYRDVLGAEVAMGHRLGREGNERHYFITVAPNTVFAFFEFPNAELPAYKEATLPSTGRALDHIAFFAENDAQFDMWYARLAAKGVANLSPLRDMGFVRAFFFADPNGIVLEVMAEKDGGMHFPVLGDPDPAY